jgi:hypothetical protein
MPTSWTKDEEKQLIKEIKDKKTFEELSKIHNRSISALMMRYNKIIYDNVEAGKDKSKLAKLLGITTDKITQAYYEHKAFMEKKEVIKNDVKEESESKSIKSQKSEKKEKEEPAEDLSKYKKMMTKLALLQKENQIMKEVIENLKLKKSLKKTIDDETIYKEVLKIIKKHSG